MYMYSQETPGSRPRPRRNASTTYSRLAVRCFKRAFRWSETTDRSVGRCVGSNAFGRLTVAGVSRCVMSV